MSDAPTTATVEIPQNARDKARELGWDDDLIDLAIGKGFSLQEVWQALRADVPGEQAKQFLTGGSMVQTDFAWMKVPTEWGVRARMADPELGLTIGDLMIGTYGDVPDVWTNRSEIARGSHPHHVQEDMGYTIYDKGVVWAESCVSLYELAIRDRWASATDLNWGSLEALPDDIEKAVCQLMTELSERAYYQGSVMSGWFPQISYGFLEAKLYLSTVVYDLARHSETFRKRALSNGGGLGLQAPTDYSRSIEESRSFPELCAMMFPGDSMLLTLYRNGELLAQNQLERDMYALSARDRQRFMDYQVERFKHYLFKFPDRRQEHETWFNKAESRIVRDWMDPAVSEPLAILLGGGRENIEEGRAKLAEFRKQQILEYLDNLAKATYQRRTLNMRMKEMIGAV